MINPFLEQSLCDSHEFFNWKQLNARPYNKRDIKQSTKSNILLATIVEKQLSQLSHYYASKCTSNEVRRSLAYLRRTEMQQATMLANLKPIGEDLIEQSLVLEQLEVNLSLHALANESNSYVARAIEFTLLEDSDHLYRLANLLKLDGRDASNIISGIDIMPYRPTISQQRHPIDDVKRYTNYKHSDNATIVNLILLAFTHQYAQQLYQYGAPQHGDNLGRKLFQELSMVEEQHYTLINSLTDPTLTELEWLTISQYVECYLYYSLFQMEEDKHYAKLWQQFYDIELFHLHCATELLKQQQSTVWKQLLPEGKFPNLLNLSNDNEKLRTLLTQQINTTGQLEDYVQCDTLEDNSTFVSYQRTVNSNTNDVASHNVVSKVIADFDSDYRMSSKCSPLEQLNDRRNDNTNLGR